MPPTADIISIASQYGAVGLILVAAGWYIIMRDRSALDERTKMQERHTLERKEAHQEILQVARDSTSALTNNTAVLSELKTIIRSRSNP